MRNTLALDDSVNISAEVLPRPIGAHVLPVQNSTQEQKYIFVPEPITVTVPETNIKIPVPEPSLFFKITETFLEKIAPLKVLPAEISETKEQVIIVPEALVRQSLPAKKIHTSNASLALLSAVTLVLIIQSSIRIITIHNSK